MEGVNEELSEKAKLEKDIVDIEEQYTNFMGFINSNPDTINFNKDPTLIKRAEEYNTELVKLRAQLAKLNENKNPVELSLEDIDVLKERINMLIIGNGEIEKKYKDAVEDAKTKYNSHLHSNKQISWDKRKLLEQKLESEFQQNITSLAIEKYKQIKDTILDANTLYRSLYAKNDMISRAINKFPTKKNDLLYIQKYISDLESVYEDVIPKSTASTGGKRKTRRSRKNQKSRKNRRKSHRRR